MKYIKTYEIKPYKFKLHDYVRVDTIIARVAKSIFKIVDRYKNDELNNYKVENINDFISFWEYESNLIPLSKEETKLLKDTIKYNL